jgi:hypothetical protein
LAEDRRRIERSRIDTNRDILRFAPTASLALEGPIG